MASIFRYFSHKGRRTFKSGADAPRLNQYARRGAMLAAALFILASATAFTLAPRSAQQHLPTPPPRTEELPQVEMEPVSPLRPKQKEEILKSNFEKMKRDADDLAVLVKSLQEEIDKSNKNVLSLKVVDKAEKIEKLAKKIKSTAKGE